MQKEFNEKKRIISLILGAGTTGYPNAKQTKPINRLKITLMSMTMDQLSKVWYNDKMEIYASIKKKIEGDLYVPKLAQRRLKIN